MPDQNTSIPHMIIRCSNEDIYYPGLVAVALNQIASKPIGQSLLANIQNYGGKFGQFGIVISKPSTHMETVDFDGVSTLITTWTNKAVRFNEANACSPGAGSKSAVFWNPNLLTSPDGDRPPFIALAHELIHAYQNLKGTAYSDTPKEEYCTVGLGRYAHKRKHTENKIRAEHGIAKRLKYSGIENV